MSAVSEEPVVVADPAADPACEPAAAPAKKGRKPKAQASSEGSSADPIANSAQRVAKAIHEGRATFVASGRTELGSFTKTLIDSMIKMLVEQYGMGVPVHGSQVMHCLAKVDSDTVKQALTMDHKVYRRGYQQVKNSGRIRMRQVRHEMHELYPPSIINGRAKTQGLRLSSDGLVAFCAVVSSLIGAVTGDAYSKARSSKPSRSRITDADIADSAMFALSRVAEASMHDDEDEPAEHAESDA